jgi:hypothetical protein
MRERGLPVRRVLLAVIAAELIVLYVLLRGNAWVYDDNLFLVLAGQEGLTWHWLTSTQFQHWDLALHAVVSLQHAVFFFDYRWGLVVLLGFLGGSIYLLERILATLIRSRWITVGFALWFGLSVLWIRPLQWWLAGAQYFPYTFFDLLCLYGFLRYQAAPSQRWILISAGALAAGLLFYEKPAYMLLYLLLFRVLLMSGDLRPRALGATFARERWLWIAYGAVVAIWLYGYARSGALAGSSSGHVTASQYMSYFRILWLQALIPSLASVRIPASHLDPAQVLFVVAAQAVFWTCVVVSIRRKPSAWRAWIFLTVIVLLSGGLVAHSRIAQFGVAIADDPRYLIDFAWLVPLTLCAAFGPGRVLVPAAPRTGARMTLPRRRALELFVVGAALLVYAGGSIATAERQQRDWPGSQARSWEQKLRQGFAALKRSSTRVVVADNATPFVIMEPFVSPYNRLSRVLGMYVGSVQVDGPLDGALVEVAEDGTVHRAAVQPLAPDSPIGSLLASQQLTIEGGRERQRAGEECAIADAMPVAVQRHLPATPGTVDAPYYLRLVARVWQRTSTPVFVDSGRGYPGAPENLIALKAGEGTSIAWLGPSPPHNVLLSIPPRTTVCLSRVDIVTVRNAA